MFPTRVEMWNGVWTLMTPFFSHIDPKLRRLQEVLAAVRDALALFVTAGVKHKDVAWRNVCLYRRGGSSAELKAVLIDLADVGEFESSEEPDAWLERMMRKLEGTV